MAKYALSLCLVILSIFASTSWASAEAGPNPAPAPAPAPIAYDLGGILNAVLKILYAVLRGENIGLHRILG